MPSINNVSNQLTTNIVPVQGTFDQNGNVINLIGPAGKPFTAPIASTTAVLSLDANGNPIGIVNPRGGRDVPSVKQTIKSAIEASHKTNPYLSIPLSAAPLWTATTVFYGGDIVRGAGNTNLYLCLGSTTATGYPNSGTSGVISPSGMLPTLITDGTVVWQYAGKQSAVGTYPLKSTVTPTVSTDVMNGYIALSNPYNATALGLTTQLQFDAASPNTPCTFTNGVITNGSTYTPPNSGTILSPNRSIASNRGCARFITNARKWVMIGTTAIGGNNGNTLKAIKINGQWLSEANLFFNVQINPACYLLDVSSFGISNKVIELFFNSIPNNISNGSSGSLSVQVDEYVYPYNPVNNYKISLEGDSITTPTFIASWHHMYFPEVIIGESLGALSTYNNAIGGTSFVGDSGGTATTYLGRLSDIVSFNPDMHIICGAHNDNSYSSSIRQAAFLTYFKAFRAALPYTTLIVGGNMCLQGDDVNTSALTSLLTTEQELLAVFNSWNDNNSLFVPVFTALPKLVTSSANGFFWQSQSAPYNNGHPSFWFTLHYCEIIMNGIRKYFQTN